MEQLKKDIHDFKIPIILVTAYCIFMGIFFGAVCPFRVFLHVDCPGCGLTRATIALLKGDIAESLHLNYTCILWLITIALFLIDRYIKPLKIKPFPVLFIISCVITLIRYILIVFFNMPIF